MARILVLLLAIVLPAGVGLATESSRAEKPSARRPPANRKILVNGRSPGPAQLRTLANLERAMGRLQDGAYWYDPISGASGRWGGPAAVLLPAGLDLGGPLPPDASGGGNGRLTGVFVNGRELHPLDVTGLREMLGEVWPGRWFVDARGDYGREGGPILGNLVRIARARQQSSGGGSAWSKRYEGTTPGRNMGLASDGTTTCVSVSGYSSCTGDRP
jgi:hypothetical protein